jgi:lysozyme
VISAVAVKVLPPNPRGGGGRGAGWAWSVACACLALAFFGAWFALDLRKLDFAEGVDVSWHQGPIDWQALAGDKVTFAYIKATEGGDHVDPRFAANWKGAGEAGLYRGAYHYFTLCWPGVLQAENFIRVVPRVAGALPPALDVEHMGPCKRGPTMTDIVGEIRAFQDRAEAHYGVRPILYTTREFHDAHLQELSGERFWIRSLYIRPRFREDDWVIWQLDNRARKCGVSGRVDLNAFRSDADALARFAGDGQKQ